MKILGPLVCVFNLLMLIHCEKVKRAAFQVLFSALHILFCISFLADFTTGVFGMGDFMLCSCRTFGLCYESFLGYYNCVCFTSSTIS